MSPRREAYRLRLVWRWSSCAAPGQRALTGLRILLRYLGLRAATVSQGGTSCTFVLRPTAPVGPSEEEALEHLRAWEPRVLGAYPGSSWQVEREREPLFDVGSAAGAPASWRGDARGCAPSP